MAWVRLDDAFPDHRKFLRAGPLAGYLHLAAIAWSNRNLTDGVIPRQQPSRLAAWHVVNNDLSVEVVGAIPGHETAVSWPRLVDSLLEEGLWTEREDGDYELHDYHDYQASAAQVRRGRRAVSETRAVAGRRGGQANRKQTRSKTGSKREAKPEANAKQNGSPNPNNYVGAKAPTSGPKGPSLSANEVAPTEEAEREDVDRLCRLLAELMLANDPKAKVAPESRGWRDAARLLLDRDGRDEQTVEQVIRWSQADEFWRSNVLSMQKLRDKFGQLHGRMRDRPGAQLRQPIERSDDFAARYGG